MAAALILLPGCVGAPGPVVVTAGEADDGGVESGTDLSIAPCPWEPGAAPAIPTTPAADPVSSTTAIALPEDIFWEIVEALPAAAGPADFDALSSALAGCPLEDLASFEARLVLALYALDGPDNLAWFGENRPSGSGTTDPAVFLFARCATVLAGRAVWARAVEERTVEWGDDAPDPTGESYRLLQVTRRGAAAAGHSEEDIHESFAVVAISPSTGSNAELWRDGARSGGG